MVAEILSPELEKEEEIVAELQSLGIRYLSRASNTSSSHNHTPAQLMAEIICQPSSRVRNALISLFLAKPEYAAFVQEALTQVNNKQSITLKFFYTAAVFLQRKFQPNAAILLPDLFSDEIGLSKTTAEDELCELSKRHQKASGLHINWQGTYENAAKHLFHQWELEKTWKK